ncbi:tetratricopeptide repeat protein [Nitrospirota bacterium]
MLEREEQKVDTILHVGYTSQVKVNGQEYTLVTEKEGSASLSITNEIHLKGTYVASEQFAYPDADPMNATAIEGLVRKHHWEGIKDIQSGNIKKGKRAPDYLKEMNRALKARKNSEALAILKEGLEVHPDDPFLMSYYGWLTALVDKKYKTGVDTCIRAMNLLPRKVAYGLEAAHKPLFYRNLCRTYLAAGDKERAVEAIFKGMKFDVEDGVLHHDLVKLGIRRTPFFPFFSRANFLNKHIGRLLHRREQKD